MLGDTVLYRADHNDSVLHDLEEDRQYAAIVVHTTNDDGKDLADLCVFGVNAGLGYCFITDRERGEDPGQYRERGEDPDQYRDRAGDEAPNPESAEVFDPVETL